MPPLSIRVFFKNIFQEKDLETAEKIYLKHASRLSLTPFSTSKPLLDWLWHHEIPMAVVSNKHGNLLRKEIAGLGWGNFFYTTVGSYDTPEDKPSPTPLLHALTVKKMPPNHHVWFVGDSLIDMNCAKNAGCMPVALGVEAERYGHTMIRAGNGHGLLSLLQDLKTSSTTGDK